MNGLPLSSAKTTSILLALAVAHSLCVSGGDAARRKYHLNKDASHPTHRSQIPAAFAAWKRGRELEHSGRFAEAQPFFSNALTLDPKYVDAYFESAHCYFSCENPDAAIKQLTKLLQIEPNNAEALRRRAVALKGKECWQDAYNDYKLAIKLDPDRANVYTSHAEACEHLQKYQEAIDAYTSYLEIDPGYDRLFKQRAEDYLRIGNYPKAIEDYSNMLKLNPRDDLAFKERGDLYFHLKQYQKAIDDYTQSLNIDPVEPTQVLEARAKAYAKLGRHDLEAADNKRVKELRQ